MKQTVTEHTFIQAFQDMGRGDQFSRYALGKIFDYLEEMEQGTVEETELDPVAVCCDFVECESWAEVNEQYDAEDARELGRKTSVVVADDDCIVFVQF